MTCLPKAGTLLLKFQTVPIVIIICINVIMRRTAAIAATFPEESLKSLQHSTIGGSRVVRKSVLNADGFPNAALAQAGAMNAMSVNAVGDVDVVSPAMDFGGAMVRRAGVAQSIPERLAESASEPNVRATKKQKHDMMRKASASQIGLQGEVLKHAQDSAMSRSYTAHKVAIQADGLPEEVLKPMHPSINADGLPEEVSKLMHQTIGGKEVVRKVAINAALPEEVNKPAQLTIGEHDIVRKAVISADLTEDVLKPAHQPIGGKDVMRKAAPNAAISEDVLKLAQHTTSENDIVRKVAINAALPEEVLRLSQATTGENGMVRTAGAEADGLLVEVLNPTPQTTGGNDIVRKAATNTEEALKLVQNKIGEHDIVRKAAINTEEALKFVQHTIGENDIVRKAAINAALPGEVLKPPQQTASENGMVRTVGVHGIGIPKEALELAQNGNISTHLANIVGDSIQRTSPAAEFESVLIRRAGITPGSLAENVSDSDFQTRDLLVSAAEGATTGVERLKASLVKQDARQSSIETAVRKKKVVQAAHNENIVLANAPTSAAQTREGAQASAVQAPSTTAAPALATTAPVVATAIPVELQTTTVSATSDPLATTAAPSPAGTTWSDILFFFCALVCCLQCFCGLFLTRLWTTDHPTDHSPPRKNDFLTEDRGSCSPRASRSRSRFLLRRGSRLDAESSASAAQPQLSRSQSAANFVNRGIASAPVASKRVKSGDLEIFATVENSKQAYWSGKLFKMNEEGDPLEQDSWREREVWLGQTGIIYYWSEKDERETILYDSKPVQELVVKELPPGACCYAFCLSIGMKPSTTPELDANPMYFATADETTFASFLSAANDFRRMMKEKTSRFDQMR